MQAALVPSGCQSIVTRKQRAAWTRSWQVPGPCSIQAAAQRLPAGGCRWHSRAKALPSVDQEEKEAIPVPLTPLEVLKQQLNGLHLSGPAQHSSSSSSSSCAEHLNGHSHRGHLTHWHSHANGTHLNGSAQLNGHAASHAADHYTNGSTGLTNGTNGAGHQLYTSFNGVATNGHQPELQVVAVNGVDIKEALPLLLGGTSSSICESEDDAACDVHPHQHLESHGQLSHLQPSSRHSLNGHHHLGSTATARIATSHAVQEGVQQHLVEPMQPHLAAQPLLQPVTQLPEPAPAASGDIASQAGTGLGAAAAQSGTGSSSSGAGQVQAQGPEIPRPILVISLVSASLTMASCVFNTLLPVYMVTELKMNMRSMGMFEGFLEAFSYVVRMFSGVVSDMMTSRKSAITLGFAMGAMAKFGMTGATTVTQLFASKAVDRLANGVQAAPRDALISDLAPAASRSACFGFAQSMRKWGSFLGAGACYLLMRALGNNYKLIFLMAASVTVASTLAFVLLVPSHARPLTPEQQRHADAQAQYKVDQARYEAAVQQPATAGASPLVAPTPPKAKEGLRPGKLLKDALSMGSDFYRTLLVVCMYGLGHINESMLEARAIEVGFGKAESTLVVALLALAISISAWPLGKLDDKHGPRVTFAVGMSALICGNLVLMLSGSHPWTVFGACLLLGVHWAVIQGPLLSIVVSQAPAHLRGTAFGVFYTLMALTTVAANSIYGTVWHALGASSAYCLSATLMVVALTALPHLLPRSMRGPRQQQQPQQPQATGPAPAAA